MKNPFISRKKAATLIATAVQQAYAQNLRLPFNPVIYKYGNTLDQISSFATIDDLYSIVKRADELCKTIPLYVYAVKDEKQFDAYSLMSRKVAANKNYSRKAIDDLADLQHKSMEIIGENDRLQKLLDNPNDAQSKDEFYSALYTFPFLTGNAFVVKDLYSDGASRGLPYQLWHLSPAYTNIVPSGTLPRKAIGYEYTLYGGNVLKFDANQVMHRRYFNPVFDYNGSELYGLSPLAAAGKRLTQSENESDYANNALKNNGAGGFISLDDSTLTVEAWGQIKDEVMTELAAINNHQNGNINAKKLGALAGPFKYNPINISPADMQLIEQGKITFKKLCNIYGLSDRLFNNDATGIEISIDKMLRDAYISCAIPQVNAVKALFNKDLAPLYNANNKTLKRFIDYDISDITQLQEDINEVVKRLSNAPALRINDLYDALGWGKVDDPNADVILIKQGYVALQDAVSGGMIDTSALDDENANDYNK